MVEQFGYADEDGVFAGGFAVIANGCRQMGFAGKIITHEDQPAFRLLGKLGGGGEGLLQALLVGGRQAFKFAHAD